MPLPSKPWERERCSDCSRKEQRQKLTLGVTSANLITNAFVNANRSLRFYVQKGPCSLKIVLFKIQQLPGSTSSILIFFFCWLKLSIITPTKRFRIKKDPKIIKITKQRYINRLCSIFGCSFFCKNKKQHEKSPITTRAQFRIIFILQIFPQIDSRITDLLLVLTKLVQFKTTSSA